MRLYLLMDPEFTDIMEAGDAASAALGASQMKPDVFLIDMETQQDAGIDTIHRIRQAVFETKIIALFSDEGYPELDADIDAYAYKYIDNKRLVGLIKGLCNGSKTIPPVSIDDTEVFLSDPPPPSSMHSTEG
jgi:DNA-binding NarL/FixJ family response regulator